jgi:hypothetical protein
LENWRRRRQRKNYHRPGNRIDQRGKRKHVLKTLKGPLGLVWVWIRGNRKVRTLRGSKADTIWKKKDKREQ